MVAAGGLKREHNPRHAGRQLKSGEGKRSNLRQESSTLRHPPAHKAALPLDDVHELFAYLSGHRTLHLAPLQTGLCPAAGVDPQAAYQSGYGNVWVRDYVALAQEAAGRSAAARTAVRQLATSYRTLLKARYIIPIGPISSWSAVFF